MTLQTKVPEGPTHVGRTPIIYGVEIKVPPDKNLFHGDLRRYVLEMVGTGFLGIRVQKVQTKIPCR